MPHRPSLLLFSCRLNHLVSSLAQIQNPSCNLPTLLPTSLVNSTNELLLTSFSTLLLCLRKQLHQGSCNKLRATLPLATSRLNADPQLSYFSWDPVIPVSYTALYFENYWSPLPLWPHFSLTPKIFYSKLSFPISAQLPSFYHQKAFPVNTPTEQGRKTVNSQLSHSPKTQRGSRNQRRKHPPNQNKPRNHHQEDSSIKIKSTAVRALCLQESPAILPQQTMNIPI